jgi:hypothetical protein
MELAENKCTMKWLITIIIICSMVIALPTFAKAGTNTLEVLREGMNEYPLQRQLSNPFPLDYDFTTIICIGWEGDKVTIKLTDEEDYGDFLSAFALIYYPQLGQIFPLWGNLYSKKTEASFTLTIPTGPPGIVIFLTTNYYQPSVGANPYKYTITLSYPQ